MRENSRQDRGLTKGLPLPALGECPLNGIYVFAFAEVGLNSSPFAMFQSENEQYLRGGFGWREKKGNARYTPKTWHQKTWVYTPRLNNDKLAGATREPKHDKTHN